MTDDIHRDSQRIRDYIYSNEYDPYVANAMLNAYRKKYLGDMEWTSLPEKREFDSLEKAFICFALAIVFLIIIPAILNLIAIGMD